MAQRKAKIRTGDEVVVIAGKDRGARGKVKRVIFEKKGRHGKPPRVRVVVENVNIAKKHQRPVGRTPGGIIEVEMPLDISNVMLWCPHCGRGVRVGFQFLEDGRKVRVCKRCGEEV